jgi:hypothetical protein
MKKNWLRLKYHSGGTDLKSPANGQEIPHHFLAARLYVGSEERSG